jgi:hypothetical protein
VPGSPVEKVKDGVTVRVRVAPRAARDRIVGLAAEPDGKPVLKVGVTAPPEGGKANHAVIKLLAKSWRMPKTAISVKRGASDRRKLLHVAGAPGEVEERLNAWMRENYG